MKSKFFALAKRHGIDAEYTPRDIAHPATIDLYAPPGKTFNTSGCHTDASIDALTDAGGIDWPRALDALGAIVGHGMSDCTDADCDICRADFE